MSLTGSNPARWKAPCEVEEDGGNLGQRATVNQQGWHLAFGVEPEIGRASNFFFGEGDRLCLEGDANFVQGNMRRHRARARRKKQSQHVHTVPWQ